MAILRDKRKLAALNKEIVRNFLGATWHKTQLFPDHKTTSLKFQRKLRVESKKLSQELSRMENRILGALSCLDDFLMNPLVQGHSGDVPERIWLKPGNEWGQLTEWSSSWSRHLSEPDYTQLWPRRWPRQLPKLLTVFCFSIFFDHVLFFPNFAIFKSSYQSPPKRNVNQYQPHYIVSWTGAFIC